MMYVQHKNVISLSSIPFILEVKTAISKRGINAIYVLYDKY